MSSLKLSLSPRAICLFILASGFATLSWEVVWQIKSTLALGVSAFGTALTLAVIMGGMSVGAYLMSRQSYRSIHTRPMRWYGGLELVAGVSGLLLNTSFQLLENIDTWMYSSASFLVSSEMIIGIVAVLAIPAICIGATLPIYAAIAREYNLSLSYLYSLNTLGAALSVLAVAFILIPVLGMTHTIWLIASINIVIGVCATFLFNDNFQVIKNEDLPINDIQRSLPVKTILIVFITGFATFILEIAWFRSITSMLPGTTDVFAMILACVLIALGLAAKKVKKLKESKRTLGVQLCYAGLLILLLTPLMERLDYAFAYSKQIQANTINASAPVSMGLDMLVNQDTLLISGVAIAIYIFSILLRFLLTYSIIVPPMRFLGLAFPWLLDDNLSPHQAGKLYAVNTLAAIFGSIFAAWWLLPLIGFAKSAWLAGVLVLLLGIFVTPGYLKRAALTTLGVASLLFAIHFETGIGKTRVQGLHATDEAGRQAKLLEFYNGPDAAVAAVEYRDGSRILLINSIAATWESGATQRKSIHYMAWMGYLPMMLHPDPKSALVICFGTGQTANAVRNEHPRELDIVDVNANVFTLAHHFKSNDNVLLDPSVTAITMDGRAYLRRTEKKYDVITLEPMPPSLSGVNALYSREFYQLARAKLSKNGVIAQWLPFQVVAPHYSASIAKTFQAVFPNAVLWIDRDSQMGILLGSNNDEIELGSQWPGLSRVNSARDLMPQAIQSSIMLNAQQMQAYSQYGEVITDDNQLLAYGKALYANGLLTQNFKLLQRINGNIKIPEFDRNYS